MSIVLYHHPWSRAAGTVWALEEVGVDYELRWVDIMKGAQKGAEVTKQNPMGKLPTLVDADAVVTEAGAIALYLADRYAPGRLAPPLNDTARGTYLRWSFFAPSVIEPGLLAKAEDWKFKDSQAGWGQYDSMIAAMESALQGRDFVLGKEFSMADVVFGGTTRYMLSIKMLEPRPLFTAYAERLGQREALQRAEAKNAALVKEHGLDKR
jgi:glutathione S-transferase